MDDEDEDMVVLFDLAFVDSNRCLVFWFGISSCCRSIDADDLLQAEVFRFVLCVTCCCEAAYK